MMTQLEQARAGTITPEMQAVAQREGRPVEFILKGIAKGKIVIPHNPAHLNGQAVGIGTGLATKVNANIGTSPDQINEEEEIIKARAAVEAGTDALMDLSTAGDLQGLRQKLLEEFPQPFGTVPVYEAAVEAARTHEDTTAMTAESMITAVRRQALQGVDFMTIHAGLTQESVRRLRSQGRVTDIVSRGGSLLAAWMLSNGKENPYYEFFGDILKICQEHDVTLSLGDGLRPGCLEDATDRAQVQELVLLGELAAQARKAGVQVIIEGPGHIPMDQIQANIIFEKQLCEGAPFYVLGPLVTDLAAGYDHIACAIGGAIAAAAGADFLCYVTPSEHLRLPDAADVKEGVIASRIAAHAADIAKGIPGAIDKDRQMAEARKAMDWERQISLALAPARARLLHASSQASHSEACSMCGSFCAMKGVADHLKN